MVSVAAAPPVKLFAGPEAFPDFAPESGRAYLEHVAQAVELEAGESAGMCLVLARLRSQLGGKDSAERLARRAVGLEPKQPDARVFLAEVMILQDRMAEAVALLSQALELNPRISGGYRRLGMALDRLGDHAGAQKAFQAAIEQAPGDATAQLLLGGLLLDRGDLEQAELHLRSAWQADTNQANAAYLLSQAQTRLGDVAGARESLKRFQLLKQREKAALDARVTSYDDKAFMAALASEFHCKVAEVFVRRGQLTTAEVHLRQAVRIAPDDIKGHEFLSNLLLRNQRLQEARTECEALVRLRPKDAGYRVNLGTVLLQLMQYGPAAEQWRWALELDPNQPQALNNLTRLDLASSQRVDEALQLSRRLVEAQPTAANYDLLGWALYANGQTNQARAAAAQAVERDPTNLVYRARYQKLQAVQ